MPGSRRAWRRRWYYVDYDTERGIWDLAEKYDRSRPDILHAVVRAALQEKYNDFSLELWMPETPFHKGDETDGPTEGD